MLPSTSKLKKHIAQVCERLVKLATAPPASTTGKRSLPVAPGARPLSAVKLAHKPVLHEVPEE